MTTKPRKYRKRDKKAEMEARPRKPSPEWEERKRRIRDTYGVKFPERTAVVLYSATIPSRAGLFARSGGAITTPAPNDYTDKDI